MSKGIEWWRNATPEQKAERRAEMAAEREAQIEANKVRMAEFEVRYAARFSTEGLKATIAAGGYGTSGGVHPRQAEPLLRLDTVERRQRAYNEANTRQNLQGGILSGNIHAAVSDLLRMIEAGTEDKPMWAEGAAARHREAERAANVGNRGERIIVYPPEMRRV